MSVVYKKCIGCGACESICPQHCIKIVKNSNGFYVANYDKTKCVRCDLCKKICPKDELDVNNNIVIYAAKNKNTITRKNSSSGGVFPEIAKYYIKKGCIVGAIFNNKLEIEHAIIDNIKDLKKLNGAKYAQSNLKNVFRQIRDKLINNQCVLFSGTPCQCNALKKYLKFLKIDTTNLVICDVICHGAPSYLNLKKYIDYQEKINNESIIKINFRHKNNESIQNIKIDFTNKTYISKPRDDIYYYSFFKGYNFMNNCYKCKFASFKRCGDLTLGDFWGCDKNYDTFYDEKGISLVLVNTKKGNDLFRKICDNFNYIEVDKDKCIQPSLVEPIKKPTDNEEFKKMLQRNYDKVVRFIGEKNGKNKI